MEKQKHSVKIKENEKETRTLIIILLFWEFFTPVLTEGFLLEFEWL